MPAFDVGIMHVPGTGRDSMLLDLIRALHTSGPECGRVYVREDPERRGPWATARAAVETLATSPGGAGHIVLMNDDAVPCDGFATVAARAIAARPDEIVSFYTNHWVAPEVQRAGGRWYTTADGAVDVAIAMPTHLWIAFHSWVDAGVRVRPGVPLHNDDRINMFAQATGRRVYNTVPALVEHGASAASTMGHEDHSGRMAYAPPLSGPEMLAIDWTHRLGAHLGRVYKHNHWRLISETDPAQWRTYRLVERAYALQRELELQPGDVVVPP